ncbi:MAG: GHMP kinase [Flavobacteriaceae bacterium]|nr:GHMP kinase [Flavobacteriaceae bacterium]
MEQTFYSNGKLLITGEYLVLDGAKALALPTKFGQYLTVSSVENQEIHWTSLDNDKSIWFQETISFSEIIKYKKSENQSVKSTLVEILHEAFLLNPKFLNSSEGYRISTELTFPKLWGLGTSSTLINNISQWLQIDAFLLLKNSFGGSGYDIACAQNNTAILYQLENGLPKVEKVNFNPNFTDSIYFVYLNKKQSSKTAIENYYKNQKNLEADFPVINEITTAVLNSNSLEEFCNLLDKHEEVMSKILELPAVKDSLFSDFDGTIKSLGAWGGDFVMAVSKENPTAYFENKGYKTIISNKDMIL